MTERFGTPNSSNWCIKETPTTELINRLKTFENVLDDADLDTVSKWISSFESYIAEGNNQHSQHYNDEELPET